jgi:hypothetical protein
MRYLDGSGGSGDGLRGRGGAEVSDGEEESASPATASGEAF